MWSSILGFYVYAGLVWACETGLYWFVCADDEADRLAGFFKAVAFWPYQVGNGLYRKAMGLKFFKEID
jgi:hypothetical protein